MKKVYVERPLPMASITSQVPEHLADAALDSAYAASVNICENCGVIQDDPSYGGELIEWAPDGDTLCKECWDLLNPCFTCCVG